MQLDLGLNLGLRGNSGIYIPPGFTSQDVIYDFAGDRVQDNGLFSVNEAQAAGRISCVRGSSGMSDTQAGVWQSFGNNVLRRTDKGLRIEEARTNLMLQPQDFSSGSWLKGDTVATVDATQAPDLTTTADLLTEGIVGNAAVAQIATSTTASQPCSGGIFLKRSANNDWVQVLLTDSTAVEGMHCWINLLTGALGTVTLRGSSTNPAAFVRSAANGFWYLQLACDMAAGATNAQFYFRSATANNSTTRVNNAAYFAWQADFNTGSKVPVSPGSRASDIVTRAISGLASGTVLIRGRTAPGIGSLVQNVWEIGATTGNRILVRRNTDRNMTFYVVVSSAQVVGMTLGVVPDDTDFRVALRWGTNDFAACLNGGTVGVQASGAVPASIPTEVIGASLANSEFLNGLIYQRALTTNSLTNAQLQALTA